MSLSEMYPLQKRAMAVLSKNQGRRTPISKEIKNVWADSNSAGPVENETGPVKNDLGQLIS